MPDNADDLFTQYPELKRLRRRIHRSSGEFALFFVECNLPVLRTKLADALSEQLEDPAIQLTLPPLSDNPIQFDQLIAEHIKSEPLERCLFLFGLEHWLPTLSRETLNQTVQQLNWRRSSFARLQRPLVIWLPKYALDLLAEYTPDFYDWYSGIFVLKDVHAWNLEAAASLRLLRDSPASAANRLTKKEKHQWIHVLKSLLNERVEIDQSRGDLLNQIGMLYSSLGDYDKAAECFESSIVIMGRFGYKIGEGAALNNLAEAYYAKGDYDSSLVFFEKSLVIQKETKNAMGEGSILNNLSQIYDKRGDHDVALEILNESLVIQRKLGHKLGEGATLSNMASIHMTKENYEFALELLNQSLAIQKEIDDKSGEATTLNNISQVYSFQNKQELALEALKKSLILKKETGDRAGEGVALNNISQVYRAQGDHDTSLEFLNSALVIQREVGDVAGLCATSLNIGKNLFQKGDFDEALNAWVYTYIMAKKIDLSRVLSALEGIANQLGLKSGLEGWEALAKISEQNENQSSPQTNFPLSPKS